MDTVLSAGCVWPPKKRRDASCSASWMPDCVGHLSTPPGRKETKPAIGGLARVRQFSWDTFPGSFGPLADHCGFRYPKVAQLARVGSVTSAFGDLLSTLLISSPRNFALYKGYLRSKVGKTLLYMSWITEQNVLNDLDNVVIIRY